jgi:hypothetical protein
MAFSDLVDDMSGQIDWLIIHFPLEQANEPQILALTNLFFSKVDFFNQYYCISRDEEYIGQILNDEIYAEFMDRIVNFFFASSMLHERMHSAVMSLLKMLDHALETDVLTIQGVGLLAALRKLQSRIDNA